MLTQMSAGMTADTGARPSTRQLDGRRPPPKTSSTATWISSASICAPRLPDVTAPVTVLASPSFGAEVVRGNMNAQYAGLPDYTLHMAPNGGHYLHWDAPRVDARAHPRSPQRWRRLLSPWMPPLPSPPARRPSTAYMPSTGLWCSRCASGTPAAGLRSRRICNKKSSSGYGAGSGGFRGEASAKTWLYRITVNTCLEEVRRRGRHPEAELPSHLPAAPNGGTAASDDTYERLYAAIGALPRVDRLLLMLQLDGQTNAQIATVTELTPNHIRVRTHRARARLKQILTR